jgi:peptidoglycan/LPS O-acetylase OafA/YrhL
MRTILLFSAFVEVGTGLALLIIPQVVLTMLAGGDVSDTSLPLGRCFGIGILALGIACWPERQRAEDGSSPAFRGLLTYNILIALYLSFLASIGQWHGGFLWPGAVLHVVLALSMILVWCRRGRFQMGGGG